MNERDILRKQKRFTSYANFMGKLYTHFPRKCIYRMLCAIYLAKLKEIMWPTGDTVNMCKCKHLYESSYS